MIKILIVDDEKSICDLIDLWISCCRERTVMT